MQRHFSIWIVTFPGNSHTRCFEEQATALREAFAELGYDAPIVTDPKHIPDYAIVLAAHELVHLKGPLPPKLILYNLEQIEANAPHIKLEYLSMLTRYPVWDYSTRNIEVLKSFGITRTVLCGIGYMPVLSCIEPAEEDMDVVFIGSVNPRRRQVLEQIAAQGKKVHVGFNVYGKERDALIARAKITINMHFYTAQIFEITRVSYLLANRKCVVSEPGNDKELEAPLKDAVTFVPYEELAATCVRLLDNPEERTKLAQIGFERFRAMSLVPMLKNALTILDNA